MFWLDISHKNLLSQERCSTFYCILPLVLFALEMLFGRKKAQFNWTYSGLLCLSWTLATVAFSWPNSVFNWDFIIQDPIFSWPILIPSQAHTEQPLGHVLATFAIVTSSASFFVYSLDKSHSWSLFLFWQAIGGLLAASLGKFLMSYLRLFCRSVNVSCFWARIFLSTGKNYFTSIWRGKIATRELFWFHHNWFTE